MVFLLGDSLIGNKEPDLRTLFRQRFGDLGRGFSSSIAHTFSGGACMVTDDFETFVSGIYDIVPAGGTVTYDANGTGTGILADTIRVVYFTQAGGGTFSVQVSANGGSYTTPLPAVNSDTGGSLRLAVAKVDLTASAAALYKVRVSGTSGTTRIAGLIFSHHIGRGAVVCSLAQGGRGWTDFAQCSPDILADLGSLLRPRLIFVEETSDAAAWSDAPAVINGILLGCRTNCEVVLISPNPFILPDQEALNLEQIALMRSLALSNHWVYFDQHGLFGNATNMAEAGLLDPTGADVHPRQNARLFALAQMFECTGLVGSRWTELRNNPLLAASGVGNDSNPGFYQLSPGRNCEWWLAHPPGLSSTLYFGDWGGAYGLFGSIEGGLQVSPTTLTLFGRPGVNLLSVNTASGGAALVNAAFTNNAPVHCPSGFAIRTVTWTSGSGSPEGVVTAPVGSLYSRTDGVAGASFYVKESGTGNTGWVAK
jgi:hypothetical protein